MKTNHVSRRPVVRSVTALIYALLVSGFTTAAMAHPDAPAKPAGAGANAPALSRTDPRFIWDLTRLYPNDAAWDAERAAVLAEVPALSPLKGTLNTPAGMRIALDRISALTQRFQRLSVYASTQQSTDNRDARNQERAGLMRALGGQFSSATAWVNPEIQALGGEKVESFIPADQAIDLTMAAMKPMGDEYQALLKQAFSVRSMHTYPAEGKSSGAYQTGVYGVVPFVFLNHQDNYATMSTFAHEWGHGIHTMLAQKNQPFETAGYSLFLGELASMTNEVLLTDHMLKQSKRPDERLLYLSERLERLRGGFFRQTMFAEFELATHDALQRGEALSGKKMTQMYCGLLRKYHGADTGVMQIDPLYCHEWSTVPHFYRPFYVYVYATSIAGATAFGERILTGKPAERDTFLNVLRAGGSTPPHQLLKSAGVDMATPQPYRALVKDMNAIMDEMEVLLAGKRS